MAHDELTICEECEQEHDVWFEIPLTADGLYGGRSICVNCYDDIDHCPACLLDRDAGYGDNGCERCGFDGSITIESARIENITNATCDILEQSGYPCSYREVEYFINNAFDMGTAPKMTAVEWAVNIAEMIREELESCPTCGCTHEQGFKAQISDCPQCGFGPIEIVENMTHIKSELIK